MIFVAGVGTRDVVVAVVVGAVTVVIVVVVCGCLWCC